MASLEYQRDGSIIVTNDSGKAIGVAAGPQGDQDAAVQQYLGPPQPDEITTDDKLAALAKLLVDKQIVTAKDVKDASAIDVAAVAAAAVPDVG